VTQALHAFRLQLQLRVQRSLCFVPKPTKTCFSVADFPITSFVNSAVKIEQLNSTLLAFYDDLIKPFSIIPAAANMSWPIKV